MLDQHPSFGVVDNEIEELKGTFSDLVFLGGEAVENFVDDDAEVGLDEPRNLRCNLLEELQGICGYF